MHRKEKYIPACLSLFFASYLAFLEEGQHLAWVFIVLYS